MDLTIYPSKLNGKIDVIPSKSQAHRLLICAAFADKPTMLICPQTNRDIEATVQCLRAFGSDIQWTSNGYCVTPVKQIPDSAILLCGESGSTLRFMLPVVGALGIDATFIMEGRLPQRPLSPLWEEMERMGCSLSRPTSTTLHCSGKLKSGEYFIDGSVSSQYITGLLLGLSLLQEKSKLTVTGKMESAPYIQITREAMAQFGVDSENLGGASFRSPGTITVEGDWSNGAFFLAAHALGSQLDITNLSASSVQGDRAVSTLIPLLRTTCPTISVTDIPDLVPILSVVAGAFHGAVFTDIQRLRIKESDRVQSVIAMLESLGGKATATDNSLTVETCKFIGGTVDSYNDHRIAMSAAIAATICKNPVTIIGAHATDKSYPQFWTEYKRLGGKYEQYIR